jgi:NADH dehydrogenase FAD-containing subunit
MSPKPRALIIGGQFSGLFCAKDLRKKFNVTVVDAKEYFEYTPGVLRAYVKPAHLDALTFTLQPVLERSLGVKFIWGEVKKLDGENKVAHVKTIFGTGSIDKLEFDYCVICAGCNFGMLKPMGESLWFATIHEEGRKISEWPHIDERFLEGRRRHILEEYHKISELNKKAATCLIVGAGFIGVEWATEIEHFFPEVKLTIMDMLPQCLGPLPASAAAYCSEYMDAVGIKQIYSTKYDAKSSEFWEKVGLPGGADETYVCMGVKASNYFMPPEMLSKGPPGWIFVNEYLQVTKPPQENPNEAEKARDIGATWGDGSIYAVGDCNYGCICHFNPEKKQLEGLMKPIPKISYPGEEQALHAVNNIERMAHGKTRLYPTWWPWGAGMFATSLGPHDACFVLAANENKGSGWMVNWWIWAALQKEVIETTKINECKNVFIGNWIWHFVHHTPCNCWGRGPCFPACPSKSKGIDAWRYGSKPPSEIAAEREAKKAAAAAGKAK